MVIANIVALSIMIVGCLNWFLVGVFSFNLVTWIFGASVFARIIYTIVGLAGIWMLVQLCIRRTKLFREENIPFKKTEKIKNS